MKQTSAIKLLAISAFLVAGFAALLMPRRPSMESLLARIDREFPQIEQITTAELAKRFENAGGVALYDVRTVEEFDAGHLPGAKLLEADLTPLRANEVLLETGAAPSNPAVFYCSVGYRAAQMAQGLRRMGWTNTAVLRGSIFQWAEEKRPLEAGQGGTPKVHPHSITYAHLVPAERRLKLPGSTLLLNHLPRAEKWRLGLGIGLLLFFLVWETVAPAFPWFRSPGARLTHGWRNYLLGFMNTILAGLILVQIWLLAARWADRNDFGLLNLAHWPAWLRIAIGLLLLDAWTYGWHRLNHRVAFLWRFHRTHHSEMQMDVTSAVRFHFGEMAMSGLLRVPLIVMLGLQFKELLIYETLLFAVVQFQHANIRLPVWFERAFSAVIASPGFHRVHHSANPLEFNSNYSSILTIWDRLFRTRARKLVLAGEAGEFGVSGMNRPEQHTLVGLVETPLESP